MFIRRFARESLFQLLRQDLLSFLEEHEEELLEIFRQEMTKLDQQLPEEQVFIDIHFVPLGEELLRAVLATLKRFLSQR